MSIINVNNLSKSYKIHEKQEGLKNTIKDLFNRKYVYKDAVNDLNMTIEKVKSLGCSVKMVLVRLQHLKCSPAFCTLHPERSLF